MITIKQMKLKFVDQFCNFEIVQLKLTCFVPSSNNIKLKVFLHVFVSFLNYTNYGNHYKTFWNYY
mgnify:CR=1 FL=1